MKEHFKISQNGVCDVTAFQSPAPWAFSGPLGITPHFLVSWPLSVPRARLSINVSSPLIPPGSWFHHVNNSRGH